jgi:hypothetical protein
MSQFADAVARLTIDKDFARTTRREPDRVAHLYDLSAEEAAKLRELADAAVSDRAAALATLLALRATSALLAVPAAVPLVAPGSVDIPPSTPTLLTVPLSTPSDAVV